MNEDAPDIVRWMKVKQAAHYSSIGQNRLKRLAGDGIIKGFQDPDSKRGDWIFDRISIDDYRNNQAGQIEYKFQKLLERWNL